MSHPEKESASDCRTHHAPVETFTHRCHHGGHGRTQHEPDHLHPAPHTHSVHGLDGHRPRQRRALAWSLGLTLVAMVAEFVGGFMTSSLMLMSDAVHMLSHVVSLGISLMAIWMAARPLTARSHYGLFRSEILASLFNGIGLLLVTGFIVVEAVERLQNPVAIRGTEMIVVATGGLIVNVITALMLARSGAEDLNTRSALLHMLGDLFSSVVIVLGGFVVVQTGWVWLDPLLSMMVALVILWWAVGLLRSSCSILLERAPEGVEPEEVLTTMRQEPGVREVHDLHVWEITSGYICLTAHVVVDDRSVSEASALRDALCDQLWHRFRVAHVTLQLEAA